MRDWQEQGAGGRTLAYTDMGEADWPSLFFFHGAPSSRLRLAYLEPDLLAEGIRLVSPDRPSYGGSSPHPGRSLADWPVDVAALADALGIDRFAVVGHSSGGPYAVACAALLPERITSCIILGGVTDFAWPGAWEHYSGMECQLMRMPDEAAVVAWCVEHFGADGSGFVAAFDFTFSAPDAQLYENAEIASFLLLARREAFRQGVAGYAQDIFVQGHPWPFDPTTITVPVHLLHGDQDSLLPLEHSRYSAARIRGSVLHLLPGHGHFTILGELPALASALARATG